MNIPDKIEHITELILKRESRWKALYMAVWGFSYVLRDNFYNKNKKLWDQLISFGLPGSKKKEYSYKPSELCQILTSFDAEITLLHLMMLFVLLEELLNESSSILCIKTLDAGHQKELRAFFAENDTKNILSGKEVEELVLAKETRNCFIHNGSKIDQKWIDAYRVARNVLPNKNIDDNVGEAFSPSMLHQIEDWHSLIIKITNEVREKIKKKQ